MEDEGRKKKEEREREREKEEGRFGEFERVRLP